MSRDEQSAAGYFDGGFDLLPFRAAVLYGEVPEYPISEQFQGAGCQAASADPFTWEGAGALWYLEAIRERTHRPAAAFDDATLRVIARRTADALGKRQRAELGA